MVTIVLIRPKFVVNVAAVVRAAACFGVDTVIYTDKRIKAVARLPRELRMKAYKVDLINENYPLRKLDGVPVAVEYNESYVPLPQFVHPPDAIYVFGPEDGTLKRTILVQCHQFVMIPTKHCLNLAATVNIVLYDKMVKCSN